jgi:RND family efflux transporter MFP subunit
MKRYMLLSVVTALTTATACDSGEPGEVDSLPDVGTVAVSAAGSAPTVFQAPARIVARETANLATRASGTIEAVLVDAGATVRRGQVLVRLEAAGVESAVVRAEAQTVVTRRTYERLSNLERDGAATRQELDQAEAALRTADAALSEAQAAREYVTLRAPFDGYVSARLANPGDLAVPGRPVLVISGASGVKVEADLPAGLADFVSVGDRVAVLRPEGKARWTATVSLVVPVIELSSHRFRVEAMLDDAEDPPVAGTFARMELPGRGDASAWVPADALIHRGQLTGLYVVDGDALRLRWVRTGRRADDAVEVLAGLREGALVVREPDPALVDGTGIGGTETVGWTFGLDGDQ